MADIISIPRKVLHQEVAVRSRQRIVSGHLQPGAKLDERALSELQQVSHTPREAIRMLAAEGLVELLQARDAAGLRALMAQHLQHKRDAVLELMRAGTLENPDDMADMADLAETAHPVRARA